VAVDGQDVSSKLERLEAIPLKFLRFSAVRERTGLSRSTIWRLEREGGFPKHRKISANAVGWLEQEVNEWVLWRVNAG
jgi:prophage regulatory protein